MLHSRYWLILFYFLNPCCFGSNSLVVEGDALKDAKILQEVFANIQVQPHFFNRDYVIELIGFIEDSFGEMLKHSFCQQVWKQLAVAIHSTNIKASAVVGDIAVHFGLLNTDIVRSRLMLATMISFKRLELMDIFGILSIEKCQKYVDTVIKDLHDFSVYLKTNFNDVEPSQKKMEQKVWGKKKYLLLALLLLGLTITIIIGYKIYQKNAQLDKHRQEIDELAEALADVKMAIGMGKESQAIQAKISELSQAVSKIEQASGVSQSVSDAVEKMKSMAKDLTGVKNSVSKNVECLKEFGELVGAMDTVLRDNADATGEFVEAAKQRIEELEKTSKKQRKKMVERLDEMREYVEELDEIAGNVSGNSKWYDDILPKFSPSNSTEFFTKATATLTAAGAAKKLARSLSGLGRSNDDSFNVSNWPGAKAAKQRFVSFP